MKYLRIIIAIILLQLNVSIYAQHTFSIVAVNPATGEIGSAGATCISAEDGAQAISDIVLGVGAIHTQAYWNPTNQNNARTRMLAGDTPQEIIDWLTLNDVSNSPEFRQYGVVRLNSNQAAAYTGTSTDNVKLHLTGANYAIQGNILISADVVNDMEIAFLNTTGTLADKLMAALQGAKRPGADSRCLDYGISSASAFLRVAVPNDTDSSYGNLSLDLNVWITSTIFEPIDALQTAYDGTLSVKEIQHKREEVQLYPNPTNNNIIVLKSINTMMNAYVIYDINGKILENRSVPIPKNSIYLNLNNYERGVYFIKVFNNDKLLLIEKLIIK